MREKELIDIISEETRISKEQSREFITAFKNVVIDALSRGEKVDIPGFVTFFPGGKGEGGEKGKENTEDTNEEAADTIEKLIKENPNISETEKEALIKARMGQGKFRDDVISLHRKCPFTGVSNPNFLRASHLKPWSSCDNQERLDPLNGIPLTPVADQLLDEGFATFDDSGRAIFSPLLNPDESLSMGIDVREKYEIRIHDKQQLKYIEYHRNNIFKKG